MNESQIKVLRNETLNPTEKLFLMGLIEYPGLPQSAVARKVHIGVPHSSSVAKSLENKGFIARHKDEKWQQADIEILI